MSEFKGVVNSSQIILGCTVLAALVTSFAIWLQRKRNNKIPDNWKPVGKILKLVLYPLKSGAGTYLNEADCTVVGLKEIASNGKFPLQDRAFIIYNQETGKFLNAKVNKNSLKINTKSDGENTVTISASGAGEIKFQIPDGNGKRNKCIIYSSVAEVVDCGDEVAAWLTKVLEGEVSGWRLGCYLPLVVAKRTPEQQDWQKYTAVYNNLREDDLGAYSDLASYMILTEESLKELNGRLEPESRVTERNFRPNIIVSSPDGQPFAEDAWDWIKVGAEGVVMRRVKPCTRCTIVNIDPFSLISNPTIEPLKTLRNFRQVTDPKAKKLEGTSPVFGQYFGVHRLGRVAVGDTVYAGTD